MGFDQAPAGRVHDVVHVALECGDQRGQLATDLVLGVAQHGAQHRLRVGQRVLEAGRVRRIDAAQQRLHPGRVGPEPRRVGAQQLVQPGSHMGPEQHGVVDDLLEEDPHAQVVDRKAPVGRERVDVGRHDQQLVRHRPRDREAVLAERPAGQVADHRAGLHPHQSRRQDAAEPAEQPLGRVVEAGVVRVVALPEAGA